MMPERWQRLNELFQLALERSPGERTSFLNESCGEDTALRDEIESLLESYREVDSFLEVPAAQAFTEMITISGTEAAADPLIGRALGEFTIREKLGEGGFGIVYRAEQPALAREAVIKVLHSRRSNSKPLADRFMREARLASRLEHPYTAHVYAFGAEVDGLLWIAMEYVRGASLDELLETQGPLTIEQFVPFLDKICEVVHTAHDAGIIHRDIKPANVMVIERAGKLLPKLLDFGIAKSLDSTHALPLESAHSAQAAGRDAVKTVGIIGSPAYMAPELWEKAARADARADIYALGALAYKALTGKLPFKGSGRELYQAHLSEPVPSLGARFPAALDGVIAQAMAKRAEDRFATAVEFAAAFREASGYVERSARLPKDQSPYVGLNAFTPEQAELFFGRERETEAFLERLRTQPLLAVIGPSGAGKSSFIQAGVIPKMSADWRAITVRPGPAPIAVLAARLAQAGIAAHDLRAALERNAEALADHLRQAGQRLNCTLVLVVDQFEELFTLCPDQAERRLYAQTLARVARAAEDPTRVLLTLRDDFLMRAERLLGERLVQGLQLLNIPAREDLARILSEPARRAGYQFEDRELEREIVESVAEEPGALPLLAFTAATLWEFRDRQLKRLRRQTYVEMGGVGGALASHAEAVMAQMTKQEQRLTREAFRRLVTSAGTRAVLMRTELSHVLGGGPQADAVIERLVGARLLIASEGEGGIERIEIVHEALLCAWPRLVQWQREDADGARLRDQLRAAALQWEERGRPQGLLWRDEALREYEVWRERYAGNLAPSEEAFGEASLAAANRGRRRIRLTIASAILILIVGLVVLFQQRQAAEENALEAKRQLLELYEEQGRQELLSGNALRALVYFNEAYRDNEKSSSLRFMLAQAMQPLDAEIVSFAGHKTRITSATFSPDGRKVVTTSFDSSAKIWDAATGKELLSLYNNGRPFITATFSSDGLRLATSDSTKIVKIWDAITGRLLVSLVSDTSYMYSAAFSPDDQRVITTTADETIKLWDAITGKLLASYKTHIGMWNSSSFSPDGKSFVTASDDKTAKVWDAATGKLLVSLEGHSDKVRSAVFSPDGTRVLTASNDSTAKVWDAVSGKLLVSFIGHKFNVNCAAFSRDGARIITASDDKTAKIWDATSGKVLATYSGYLSYISFASFSPDGERILLVSEDHTAKILATANQLLFTLKDHKDWVRFGEFSPDGRRIATASSDKTAKLWDAASGQLLFSLSGHKALVHTASFSPDGRRIVTASEDKSVKVWDATTGAPLLTIEGHSRDIQSAIFSPDGRQIVTASYDSTAKVWDAATGKLLATLEGHTGRLNFATFSPDGQRIITTSWDYTAKIWDINGKLLTTLEGHKGWVFTGRFSPDGQRVVTASQDGSLRLWDAQSGKMIAALEGHINHVYYAAFSADGERIVSSSLDKTTKIWHTATGKLLASLEGHQDSIVCASFSPDGKRIVTASLDHTAKIWDTHLESRTAREIDEIVKRRVPLRLDQGQLIPTR